MEEACQSSFSTQASDRTDLPSLRETPLNANLALSPHLESSLSVVFWSRTR